MRRPRRSTFQRLLERTAPPHFSEHFFLVVQRAEYAMKRAGYLTSPRNAMASWRKLGNAVDRVSGGRLEERIRDDDLCVALFADPPSKLVVHNNMLAWQEQHTPRNIGELMDIARDIRNSLFHGEKSSENPRDEELVGAAMRVLEIVIDEAERERVMDPSLELFVEALLESPSELPVVPLIPR